MAQAYADGFAVGIAWYVDGFPKPTALEAESRTWYAEEVTPTGLCRWQMVVGVDRHSCSGYNILTGTIVKYVQYTIDIVSSLSAKWYDPVRTRQNKISLFG